MESSSWTLNTIDPSMISDLSGKLIPGDKDNKGRDEQLTGLRIKGRANEFVESDDNDGDFVGSSRWNPKQPQRSQIRVGSGIGRGRNLDSNPNRQEINTSDKYVPHDYRRKYRDRDPYPNRNNRLRSLSPDIYPPRQRNGGRAPARSPPRGRGRPPPSSSRGGSNKNRRGPPGRGRGKADNRDVYRPMPSDAKRAWDKHRL
ncbi:hypothetical protein LOZ58_000223 [Ophidiomyces ophidiicola]|nr:hypothetical protein LOZ65_006336 [Ophidiomyces ophidiicola]KAI1966735.1 hypothetical protein LOZ58_000223 [Ophidiomyces ophidiicola]